MRWCSHDRYLKCVAYADRYRGVAQRSVEIDAVACAQAGRFLALEIEVDRSFQHEEEFLTGVVVQLLELLNAAGLDASEDRNHPSMKQLGERVLLYVER